MKAEIRLAQRSGVDGEQLRTVLRRRSRAAAKDRQARIRTLIRGL